MPLLMSDYYEAQNAQLRNQVLQQSIDENKIILAERMKQQADKKKAEDIQTQVYNAQPDPTTTTKQTYPGQVLPSLVDTQTAPPEQPQGIIPQAGLTGFGGMSTPQEGPVGMQPQGDATGLGGMQPTGWSEGQDQTQVQPTGWGEDQTQQPASPLGHEAALYQTTAALDQANSKVDVIKQTVDALYKAGLPDQALSYEKKMRDAQKEADTAKLEHFKVADKVLDFIGSQANGYLTAIKNPTVDPEAAWQRMKLSAQAAGIDTSELDSIAPKDRQAYAEQTKVSAYSTKEQVGLETTLLKDKTKRDIQNQIDKVRRDVLAERTSDHAKVRELGEKRLEWSKTKFGTTEERKAFEFKYKELHEGIKTQLNQSKVQLEETDKDIKDIQTRKIELDKGNLYFDTNGHPISSSDEETRNAESKLLLEKLAVLNEKKNSLLKDVEDLGNNQTELEKSLPKFSKEGAGSKSTPVATTPDKSQAISKELITRFTSDPATKGMTLGKHTESGWEVKNNKGAVVGHYE